MPDAFDEEDRLRILAEHDLHSDGVQGAFRDLTRFAAELCEAPICLVSLVERERQRFVSTYGLSADGTPRDVSFCVHAMAGRGVMVVPNATLDDRFVANPLVTGEPHIRFYAGAPLRSDEGAPLGALCVIDTRPREGLTALQQAGLLTLADAVSTRLSLRRARKAREIDGISAERALLDHDRRFRVLADAMPQMVWSTLPDGYHDYYNARWYEFTGTQPGSTDGEGWAGMFHPDDQPRAWAKWRRSLETGDPYEVEYRLRNADGVYRWTLGRALPVRDDDDVIVRWFGTCTDIHEQKLLMEQREIVSQELSHRIKNIFAIVAGMITLASRRLPGGQEAAVDLRDRVIALGRAHDFVRPHSPMSRPTERQTSLFGMLRQIFEPYRTDAGRIAIEGDDPDIDDRSTTPLALIFHELATNSAKHGALSRAGGRVRLEITEEDAAVRMVWNESGGPTLEAPPTRTGFGVQLLDMSVQRQLGGTLDRVWNPEGLVMTLTLPAASIRRRDPQTA